MRNKLLSFAIFGIAVGAANAAVTINLGVGQLYGTSTSSVFPDGGLVQLLASTTDSVFGSPTVGSFVSGDDLVLASFEVNSSVSGLAGAASVGIVVDYSIFSGLGAGDSLLLRWFPELSSGASSSSVVAGTVYGQFSNTATTEDGSSLWLAPADGQSIDLLFLNSAAGGSYADSLGLATNTVVPEPSTYAAVLGSLMLGVVGYRRFRKR